MVESDKSVAFLGLGAMGLPMATRLVERGHQVTVVKHRSPEVVEALEGDDIEVSCDVELRALADPDHFEQILFNYIANAQKHGKAPIAVRAEGTDQGVILEVRDHGDGVPRHFRSSLFERFTQAHRRPEGAGTGLGLSIVEGLAEAQGGNTWFEPNTPTGSRFFLRLPAPSSDA